MGTPMYVPAEKPVDVPPLSAKISAGLIKAWHVGQHHTFI